MSKSKIKPTFWLNESLPFHPVPKQLVPNDLNFKNASYMSWSVHPWVWRYWTVTQQIAYRWTKNPDTKKAREIWHKNYQPQTKKEKEALAFLLPEAFLLYKIHPFGSSKYLLIPCYPILEKLSLSLQKKIEINQGKKSKSSFAYHRRKLQLPVQGMLLYSI